jgi:hypothetical protein
MSLFIQDAPFREQDGVDSQGELFRYVEICLPIAITEPTALGPPESPYLIEFVLDTSCDYAIVSEDHLVESGISLAGPSGGRIQVTWVDSSTTLEQTRDVSLWLYSNVTQWRDTPYRIELNGGVVVFTKKRWETRPLLGLNPLLDGGLRIELDALMRTLSVWVPD